MPKPTLKTALCDLLEIEYPVLLAGMGTFALPELVAAVSNAGGLGVLGATGLTVDGVRDAIRQTRSLTNKPFGLDLILPQLTSGKAVDVIRGQATAARPPEPTPALLEKIAQLRAKHGIPEPPSRDRRRELLSMGHMKGIVEITLEERVPVFVTGLGNPAELVPDFHRRGIRVLSLVGNTRAARAVAAAGVDAVIAQGHEAGGHTGRIGTLALVPQVVDAVRPRPVVAAGGIGDGRGLVAALALGAVGVWCGTVFAASAESAAPRWYKERCVAQTEEDTVVTRVVTGKTCRVQKNRLVEAWDADVGVTLPMPVQAHLFGPLADAAEAKGMTEYLGGAAGQVAGMIREIKPAGRILQVMVAQAAALLEAGLGARTAPPRGRPAAHGNRQ